MFFLQISDILVVRNDYLVSWILNKCMCTGTGTGELASIDDLIGSMRFSIRFFLLGVGVALIR
jgi:hypothetical protein